MPTQRLSGKLYLFFGFFAIFISPELAYSQASLPPVPLAKLGSAAFRHEHAVTCLAYSPDGKLLASGGSDFTVRLWDCRSAAQVREFQTAAVRKDPFVGARQVNAVAFSPDGKWLAAGAGDHSVTLWEAATGKEIFKSANHQGPVQAVVFTPDGKKFMSAGADQTIRLWQIGTKVERVLTAKDQINALAINREGTWLISGAADGQVQVWDIASGKEVRFFEAHKGPVLALALSPDNKQLVTAGADKAIRIWEIASEANPQLVPLYWSGVPLLQVPGLMPMLQGMDALRLHRKATAVACEADRVQSVLFSRDGKSILWAGHDGSIYVSNVEGKQAARPVRRVGPAIRALCLSPDGETLAAGDEFCCVQFWNWKEGRQLAESGPTAPIESVLFQKAGQQIVSSNKVHELDAWNYREAAEKAITLSLPPGSTTCCLAPTQELAASGDGQGSIHLWNRRTGRQEQSWKAGKSAVSALALSMDGRTIAAGLANGNITLWEVATRSGIDAVHHHEGKVAYLAFSPNGKHLAASSGNECIVVWNLSTQIRSAQFGETGEEVQCFQFSPDSQILAVGTRTGRVRFWDVATGKSVWHTEPMPGYVMSLAYSTDGRTLAAGSWLTMRMWELTTRKERFRLEGLPGDATALAFDATGRMLAIGNSACTIWVFDLAEEIVGKKKELILRDTSALWSALSAPEASRAYMAVWKLTLSPDSTLALLKDRLKPVPIVSEAEQKRLFGLINSLDRDEFQVRQSAEAALRKDLFVAEPQLREMLVGDISTEMRGRIEALLQLLETPARQAALWQMQRAIEVLEKLANKDAQELLRQLAAGQPEALLTKEAKAALGRLQMRGKS